MAKRKKVQKDKQWSTKHTYKTKDRVTWTKTMSLEALSVDTTYYSWREDKHSLSVFNSTEY